jgi:hypothetical protein
MKIITVRRVMRTPVLLVAAQVDTDTVTGTLLRRPATLVVEQAMWLESAGGGLRVSSAGRWLAAMNAHEVAYVNAQRRAFANLMWDRRFGDRHSAVTVMACGADPAAIRAALTGALLTDDEMAAPGEWHDHADPFGDCHEDPCVDSQDAAAANTRPMTAEAEPPE